MAIIQIGISSGGNIKHFVGLSTDQKPVTDIGGGSDFTEVDKSVKYIYDPENINPLTSTGWWLQQELQNGDALGKVIPLTTSVGSITGGYLKIGRQITVTLEIVLTIGIATGDVICSGLPICFVLDEMPIRGLITTSGISFEACLYPNGSIVTRRAIPNIGHAITITFSYIAATN